MKSSVEKLDFSQYDRVIVSSSWFAHWLKTWKDTKTIVYYHAPARYMWDWTHEYRKEINMNSGLKWYLYGNFMKKLRVWDYNAAQHNDILLANSATTASRIQKYFRRDSQVVYPPIETQRFAKQLTKQKPHTIFSSEEKWDARKYYIILSALTEFKKLDIAIHAFTKLPEVNLLIIGAGEYKWELEKISNKSKNIVFSGARYGDDLVYLVQNSSWLIFPGEEDFGMVPIEVMAAGKPVFALRKWWLTETVLPWKTWDFFNNPDGWDFVEHFQNFHKNNIKWNYLELDCKNQAAKYDSVVFTETIKTLTS
jgi:glycosyltransferase involved in cell wall biosynthesis